MPYAVTGMGGNARRAAQVDGEEILSRIERHGVTLLCGAPAVVAAILSAAFETRAAEGRVVPGRGTVRHGGGRCAAAVQDDRAGGVRARWEFIQIYGLTETAPLLHHQPGSGGVGRSGHRGTLAIVEPAGHGAGRPGPPSTTRRGAGAFQSCLCRVLGAAARDGPRRLQGGWFHTGDGGYFDSAHVVISDRKKDVIITGGENVSSIEVEDCLYQHEAVPRSP